MKVVDNMHLKLLIQLNIFSTLNFEDLENAKNNDNTATHTTKREVSYLEKSLE